MSDYRIYIQTEKSKLYTHPVNEDRCLFSEFVFMKDKKIRILLIADGMGGLSEGDKASRNAVLGFSKTFFEKTAELYIEEDIEEFSISYFAGKMEKIVKESFKAANDEVCRKAEPYVTTGTTLSAVCIADGYAVAANVGDSPIYLYRAGTNKLKLISELQTRAELEAKAGKYERYSPEYYEYDHYLYRSLGEYATLEDKDICCCVIGNLKKGDIFLMGSDGAFGRIQEDEIQELLEGCEEDDETFVLTQLFDSARMDKQDDQTAILYVVGEGEGE